MDADDISLPDRIKIQVDFMQTNPDIHLVGTAIETFGENRERKILIYPLQDALIKFNLLFYCCFAHPTMMMRVSIIDELKYS